LEKIDYIWDFQVYRIPRVISKNLDYTLLSQNIFQNHNFFTASL